MREDTIGGANPLDIDAGRNGGIRVRGGWDRGDVLVRSKIRCSRRPPTCRRALASSPPCASTRRAAASTPEGPDAMNREENWNVSFEINVPRNAMLTLNTGCGGISIDDFRGTAKFHASEETAACRSPTSAAISRGENHQRWRHRRRQRRSLGWLRPRRPDDRTAASA